MTINLNDVVAAVRTIAAEHPDRVYNREFTDAPCKYAPDDANPFGCIMGFAIRLLGESTDEGDEGRSVGSLLTRRGVRVVDGNNFDIPEVLWLRVVQQMQDRGKTWANAVAAANAGVTL